MKVKVKRVWILELAWHSPYTSPPDGKPRVIFSCTVDRPHPLPAEILEAYEASNARGYCISIRSTEVGPVRRLSDEAKGKIRRRNLERRVAAKAPLFAEQIIQHEFTTRPDYFAGKPV
jgi:hypothetical protein